MLTDAEKSALSEQIANAERASGGEIITVIANSSDDYRFFPVLWAALIALAVPGALLLFGIANSDNGWSDPVTLEFHRSIYVIQALVFLFLAVVLQWAPLRLRLVPKDIKALRASRNARAQFIAHQVHWTTSRSGVLIFVSVAERHVDIIVDRTISEVTDENLWQDIVNNFTTKIRSGQVAEGFSITVDACKQVLIENQDQLVAHRNANAKSGADSKNKQLDNELPNHLIEVQ